MVGQQDAYENVSKFEKNACLINDRQVWQRTGVAVWAGKLAGQKASKAAINFKRWLWKFEHILHTIGKL